jgi:hypothetical protein
MTAILERMNRCAICHQQRRTIVKGHGVRHFEAVERCDCDLFGQPAIAAKAYHAVANGKSADAIANRFDDTGDFAAGRKGAFWFELIQVDNHQRVGEVDRTRLYRNDDLAGASNRLRQFAHNERVGAAAGG